MSPFIIRRAATHDAEAIAQCHKEAVEKRAAAFYSPDVISEWSWGLDRIENIRREIQNQDFIFLVASSDNDILGYGIANPIALELKALSTIPNKKGRVGVSLLAVLLEQCKKQGCDYLGLSSSLNAEKFYLDNGFRVIKKDQHILSSGLAMDCIKMRIELDSNSNP